MHLSHWRRYWGDLRSATRQLTHSQTQRHQLAVQMQYTTLGRTGLKVSVAGLGGGGRSRWGLKRGLGPSYATQIVREALDYGINLLDTSETYGTEAIIQRAIQDVPRDSLVLSTKKVISTPEGLITAKQLKHGVERSLRRLGTDYIDLYHLHGVLPQEYDYALTVLLPTLMELRQAGKIRFLGITEAFAQDTQHEMLSRAVQDDCWDVVMVGFNLLNQSARDRVLKMTQAKNIGAIAMFAVRRALTHPQQLSIALQQIHKTEALDEALMASSHPLGFLWDDGAATNLPDVAYRFCRHEPGVHTVLFGTGDFHHLSANIKSLLSPQLADDQVQELRRLFEHIVHFSGD